MSSGSASAESGAAPRLTGHRHEPHGSDTLVEVWGPDQEACIREMILATVASFADTSGATADAVLALYPGVLSQEDAFAYLLGEVIHSVQVRRAIPVGATVERSLHGGLCVILRLAPLDYRVRIVGPVPKAAAPHEVACGPDPSGGWRARFVLGV